MLRALFATNQGQTPAAVQGLEAALPFELGVPGSWSGFYGNLYPAYVRGLAYLAGGKSTEAAGEFQKIVDHKSLVWCDPVGAVARLQFARALALSGDSTKAKIAYKDGVEEFYGYLFLVVLVRSPHLTHSVACCFPLSVAEDSFLPILRR